MAASTRPLTLGEILDRTVQLLRSNFFLFVGIAAAPSAITVLVSGAASIFLLKHLNELKPDAAGALKIVLQMIVFAAVGIPLLLAAYSLEISAATHAALAIVEGQETSIRASYAKAFHKFWRYVWLLSLEILLAWIVPYLILMGIVVVGAIVSALALKSLGSDARTGGGILLAILTLIMLILFFSLCIWLWLRFSLAFPASISEDKPAWRSMQRSEKLSKGTRGRILVLFVLLYVLSLAVNMALSLPVDILIALASGKSLNLLHPAPAIATLVQIYNLSISFLVGTVITPLYGISLVLFYLDQRTRQEGYDIEQLMAQAGWAELPRVLARALPVPDVLITSGTDTHGLSESISDLPASATTEGPLP